MQYFAGIRLRLGVIRERHCVARILRMLEWRGQNRLIAYLLLALMLCVTIISSVSTDPAGIHGRRAGQVVEFDWTATEVEQWAGRADVGSYIRGAQYFLEHGRFYASTINLWPPGQTYLAALIIRFTGEGYYPAKILALNAVLWWLAVMMVFESLRAIPYGTVRVILSIVPFFFENIRSWIFGYGVLGSESFAHPLFIISVCLFLQWSRTSTVRSIVAMAFAMAALAYLRGYFEMLGNVMILVITMLAVLQLSVAVLRATITDGEGILQASAGVVRRPRTHLTPRMQTALVAALVFFLLLLPWRLYNVERGNTLSWIHANYYWSAIWKPDSSANRLYVNLGINIPCHVDPKTCEALQQSEVLRNDKQFAQTFFKRLTVVTFLTHPVSWYMHRAKYFHVFWFGSTWEALFSKHKWRFAEGTLLLAAAVFSVVAGIAAARRTNAKRLRLFLIYIGTFALFNLVLFTFLHLQYRYSIFIRLFCAYLPVWIWACCLSAKGKDAD